LPQLLVIIGGPTASGKTGMALQIAKYFRTEIVSADSRQFFRELNIGTAKPSPQELSEVPHHFINSHSLTESFNAADYGEQARKLIQELFTKHDVVVMAGGSGLYIDAVIHEIDDLPKVDNATSELLDNIFQTKGISALQSMLSEADPATANVIDLNNPRRVIRALGITLSSGKKYSELIGKKSKKPHFNFLMAGINHPREELYERIHVRTMQMISDGLLAEVVSVAAFRQNQALQTVGYRELFDYLDEKVSFEDAVLKIEQHTRNYAKRQLTWFRKYSDMIWLQPGCESELIEIIKKRLAE
jgi:tRNA dimethylallyltransferase